MAEPVPAVLCLTASGAALASRVAEAIGGTVHGRAGRVDAPVTFDDTMAHVRALYAAGTPIVGICAAGILIRAIAPLLGDKHTEPPVLAIAQDGSAVIPLVGGHRGANALARRIGGVLDIGAAITTAGDLELGVALDAPPPGWRLSNPQDAATVMAGLLAGDDFTLSGEADFLAPLAERATRTEHAGGAEIRLTGGGGCLSYDVLRLTIGVGCARNCPADELAGLVRTALTENHLSANTVAGIYSLDLKADEAAVNALAIDLGVPARFFDAAALEAETPRLANPSEVVFAEVGCHGVAEAAALAAAGPEAELLVEKQKSANATVAIARAPAPITALPGRARGKVALVGIGPGQAAWRTPEASRLIARADELVGYGLYIDLLGPLAAGKPRRDFPLGGEEDRCRYALEQAGKGREVALICSGDAGIYAMGALVYELLARPDGLSDAARRVEVVSAPGISALQAAAARIGAPLGHDFCAISLSDLLTPRADIEKRIKAAAEGDFVIAFYNPVSRKRRDLFVHAQRVLLAHRPADTPVLLASSLGRPEEHVRLRPLAEVTVDEVDMLTVVIVGSSQSARVRVGGEDRMFTPRGYAAKHSGARPA